MALGSQALSQAEIDKQKAANKDITNWNDNITGGGTNTGTITAAGTKKATRKVEKMAESNEAYLKSFNNKTDIAKAKGMGFDISDKKQLLQYINLKGQKLGYRDKQVNLNSSWNAGINNTSKKIINNTTPSSQSQSQSITNNVNTGGKSTTTTPPPANPPANSSSTSSTGYTGNNPNAGQWQKQNVTNNINISGLSGGGGSTGGGGGPTNPASPGGIAKNIDGMLGRQPKLNTFKKTTGLTNNQPGGKTPYKFRGLENQFQSWQMQHYNNDTTT
jgi:hypothetical protein